jgi:hypothetical protein
MPHERVVIEITGMSYCGYVLGGSTRQEFTTRYQSEGRAQVIHHILILDLGGSAIHAQIVHTTSYNSCCTN